ncbi:hypothetical protein B566_EDAN013472 [Ephemera danica]|nr:hypothetical protein B566_EDAN013472 [Ephemera danica]
MRCWATTQRRMILNAMAAFQNTTCMRFRPYNSVSDRDFVSIESGKTGCWSNLGRIGGKQALNLQVPGCVTYIGTVIHELMHVAGFFHKQSRPDRNDFVTIHPENIENGMEFNFELVQSATFNIPYDYDSVMHYSGTAFSKNGLPTITAKVIILT